MLLRRLALATATVICTLPVQAQFVPDPANDFIPIHAPVGGYVPSLDVLFAYGTWTSATQTFTIGAVMAGAISTMPTGSSLVWGFDRSGVNAPESFVTDNPATSTGGGVNFDSVLAFGAGSTTVTVNQRAGFIAPGTAAGTPLPSSAIHVTGNVITIDIPAAALPSLGRSFAQYTWNLWPRTGPGNAAITDFAPNDVPIVGTAAQRYGDAMAPFATVTVVPEPASAALMLAGVAGLAMLRRRKSA